MKSNNYTKYSLLLIFAVVLMTVATQITAHDESKQESFDFAELACWDVMVLSEQDRPYALTLLYGYAAGKNNIAIHTGENIKNVLKKTGEICTDKPDDKVLTVIQQIIKQ